MRAECVQHILSQIKLKHMMLELVISAQASEMNEFPLCSPSSSPPPPPSSWPLRGSRPSAARTAIPPPSSWSASSRCSSARSASAARASASSAPSSRSYPSGGDTGGWDSILTPNRPLPSGYSSSSACVIS